MLIIPKVMAPFQMGRGMIWAGESSTPVVRDRQRAGSQGSSTRRNPTTISATDEIAISGMKHAVAL
jgi:hypothetical protein